MKLNWLLLAALVAASPLPPRTESPSTIELSAPTPPLHHRHYRRGHSSNSTSSDRPSLSSSMPSVSLISLSLSSLSLSYSYSIAIPHAAPTGGHAANPYIWKSSLPYNLVFIVVGAVLAFLLAVFAAAAVAMWAVNRRRALKEATRYFGNYTPGGGSGGLHSSASSLLLGGDNSQLSLMEKASGSWGSNSSIMMLRRQLSAFNLDQSLFASNPGRSYREMVAGQDNMASVIDPNHRGSMYISPVFEMAQGRSALKLDLTSPSESNFDLLASTPPIPSPSEDAFTDDSYPEPRLLRPPSLVLEELLDR